MKTLIKTITTILILLITIMGFFVQRLQKDIVSFPVEDGVVILNPNNSDYYLHISAFNSQLILQNKTKVNILGDDKSNESSLQFPISPSFHESYYTKKSFYSFDNKSTVKLITQPSILNNSIQITQSFISPLGFQTLIGIEIMNDVDKVYLKDNNLQLESKKCTLTIKSTGEYHEQISKIIWYITDESEITFDISILCTN